MLDGSHGEGSRHDVELKVHWVSSFFGVGEEEELQILEQVLKEEI